LGTQGVIAAGKAADTVETPLLVQVEEENQEKHDESSYRSQERRGFRRNCKQTNLRHPATPVNLYKRYHM
jgi:hypothetical protein